MKELQLPALGFKELFTVDGPYEYKDGTPTSEKHWLVKRGSTVREATINENLYFPNSGTLVVSNYLSLAYSEGGQHQNFAVTPTRRLFGFLLDAMLPVEGDRIYFGATMRLNNTMLITARYNQIIGNRWLNIYNIATADEEMQKLL
jgi:hypothetical protein